MDKKESNRTRINLIKAERCELLKEVRENINNGTEKVLESVNDIVNILNYDEKNIKKYEALKEAQKLIESLTKEIVNATTKEEVEVLRKKLNYYINKVKNEAKKRNIDYNKYYGHVNDIRKSIAKYIRFIKRKEQIDAIENANDNYDSLDEETRKLLSRQISNARNYNTRVIREQKMNIINSNNSSITSIDNQEKNNEESDNNSVVNVIEASPSEIIDNDSEVNIVDVKEITLNDIKKKNERSNSRAIITEDIPKRALRVCNANLDSIEDHKSSKKNILSLQKEYKSDEDYISSRVSEFDIRYKLLRPMEYNQSFGKNIVTFVRNIPIYSINKKKIEKIGNDYTLFHRGDDLGVYLEYIKKDNTIIAGLMKVLHNSALYNSENKYLNNHDRCVNWILSVVREKEINLSYRLAK